MVTLNLLPWRPLTRHYRQRCVRQGILAGLILATLLVASVLLWSSKTALTVTVSPPVPLPASPPPTEASLEYDRMHRMQQAFSAVLPLLADAPPFTLTRLLLLPASLQIEGNTVSLKAWLNWLGRLQKQRAWHLTLKKFEQLPANSGMHFILTLVPRTRKPLATSPVAAEAVEAPALLLKQWFATLPDGFTLDALLWPEEDNPVTTLQAHGHFAALLDVARHLSRKDFFCPVSKMEFTRRKDSLRLILKWHTPCFRLKNIAPFPEKNHLSVTDPFHLTQIFPAPAFHQDISLKTLELAGWLRRNHTDFAILRQPDGSLRTVCEHMTLGREQATVRRIRPGFVLLETANASLCITSQGIQKENSACADY